MSTLYPLGSLKERDLGLQEETCSGNRRLRGWTSPSGKVVAGLSGSQVSLNTSSSFPWLPDLGEALA